MLNTFKLHPTDHEEIKLQKDLGHYEVIPYVCSQPPKACYTSKGLSFENTTIEIQLQQSVLLTFASL